MRSLSALSFTLAMGLVLMLATSCRKSLPPLPQDAPVEPALETPTDDETQTDSPTKSSAIEAPIQGEPRPAPIVPSEKTSRLAVGEQAPDFGLQDQDGIARTLAGLLDDGKVALVFYRSADW